MIIKFLLWIIIIPSLLGMIYTYYLKDEKNNVLLAFVAGYVIEFALFEIITIPITFLKVKFTTLLLIWNVLLIFLSIASIILNMKRYKEFFISNLKKIRELHILTILVVILIGLQLFVVFRYMHVDDDDAFYVGLATTTIYTNQIGMYNPARGNEWGWQSRYVLSPFSIYIAVLSEEIGLAPTAMAHTICPVVFVAMMYMVYTLIAQKIFKEDRKARCLFLILINILYIFGNYSVRTNFTFALFRIWQGKAFLANIILPIIWYSLIVSSSEKMEIKQIIMMLFVMTAACMPTSMGIVQGSLTVAVFALVFAIKEKNICYLWKYAITCAPCIICGVISLML